MSTKRALDAPAGRARSARCRRGRRRPVARSRGSRSRPAARAAARGAAPAIRRRTVRSGQLLDVVLEVVDLLVQAVEELEEGVGRRRRRPPGRPRPASHPRRRGPRRRRRGEVAAGSRLPDRHDAVGVATTSSSRYSTRSSPLTRLGVRRGLRARSCPWPSSSGRALRPSPGASASISIASGSSGTRRPRGGRPPASGRRGRSTARPRRPRLAPGSAVAGRRASSGGGGRRQGGVALLAQPALGVERRRAARSRLR